MSGRPSPKAGGHTRGETWSLLGPSVDGRRLLAGSGMRKGGREETLLCAVGTEDAAAAIAEVLSELVPLGALAADAL